MEIVFEIKGPAVGKQRPRAAKMGKFVRMYTPPKTVEYENLVKMSFAEQVRKIPESWVDGTAPLTMSVHTYFAIPASMSKKDKILVEGGLKKPMKKPDCDNILKSIADGLNGVAYKDDVQIVTASLSKHYTSDLPYTTVIIQDAV